MTVGRLAYSRKLQSMAGGCTMPSMPPPSHRERVRELHAAGLTTRQIAAALNISTQAVSKHLRDLGLVAHRKAMVS